MFAQKARKRQASDGAAPAGKDMRRRANRPPAPIWSLSGVPAFQRSAKDDSGATHGAGCSCCAAKGLAKDGPFAVPAPAPTPAGPSGVPIKRTVTVFPVSVGGSTRSSDPDITKASSVWSQCGLAVKAASGQCWTSDVLDTEDPKGSLNEFKNPSTPTSEEKEMLGFQPGGSSAIHAYYVPKMSDDSRGEAFLKASTPDLPEAIVVSDAEAVEDTLAHELGHILLEKVSHHDDPDNVMANGNIRNVGVDKLDDTQCGKAAAAPAPSNPAASWFPTP